MTESTVVQRLKFSASQFLILSSSVDGTTVKGYRAGLPCHIHKTPSAESFDRWSAVTPPSLHTKFESANIPHSFLLLLSNECDNVRQMGAFETTTAIAKTKQVPGTIMLKK